MSARLSDRQHRRLLEMIQRLQRCRSLEEFPALVNEVFLDAVPCDSVSYNEIYPGMNRYVSRIDPVAPENDAVVEKWKLHAHQHPVLNYVIETGDGSAHQIADFLSPRQFHALDLYQNFYREIQVEHQMAITVTLQENIVIGVAMNRLRSRFSETERLVANLLRPHVCEAYLTLVELGHLRGLVKGLASALDEKGEGIVFWSLQEVVLNASPAACEMLGNFLGWRNGRTLPDELAGWAREQSGNSNGATGREFICEKAGARLVARLVRHPAFHYVTILIREEPAPPTPAQLMPMGMSKREAEVLFWLAEGKSNTDIAAILGVSPLTVKTQVLSILRKLGVENRTTAAARVHDFLKSRPVKS